ncbi:hypothetical protein SAMN04487961_3120 [Marinobacter pelagius]|uniref:Uncharacterized protein n=1 Tax=Marinobacter pelagius TaxID=379482 RepID=A0A1I4Z317_9GAMM|nr:hypothetical protein SAMN04487961_3120 [Marinobacter pelagius]
MLGIAAYGVNVNAVKTGSEESFLLTPLSIRSRARLRGLMKAFI